MRLIRSLSMMLVAALFLAGCVGDAVDAPVAAADASTEGAVASVVAETVKQSGTSSFHVTGVCLPTAAGGSCSGLIGGEDGRFALATVTAAARLESTWVPASPTTTKLNVSIWRGDERMAFAEGTEPLTLDLGELAAGTYAVRIWFPHGSIGDVMQEIAWTVTGTAAPQAEASGEQDAEAA